MHSGQSPWQEHVGQVVQPVKPLSAPQKTPGAVGRKPIPQGNECCRRPLARDPVLIPGGRIRGCLTLGLA